MNSAETFTKVTISPIVVRLWVYSQTPSRKIESTVIVVAARVATVTTAHHASTGSCFSKSFSTTLRMLETSASVRA